MKDAQQLYIGGSWRATPHHDTIVNPATGAPIQMIALGDDADMDAAIAAAFAARASIAALTNAARGDALDKIRTNLTMQGDTLPQILSQESGKPIKDARIEVQRAMHVFQIAAEEARRFGSGETIPLDRMESSAGRFGMTSRFPCGVVGAITPFNFPLNLVAHKVAPALASGNTVVLKPAHQTPLTAFKLAEAIDAAGLPPGAFNVIHSRPELGSVLATDSRVSVLSFTGSARIGWDLKAKANRKRVTLELGGNAAAIVHEDADIAYAAARCAIGAFSYAGQVCISVQRLLVHASVYETFLDAFLNATRKLKVGDPLDETTDIGPMLSPNVAKRTEEWVTEAISMGATLLLGDGKAQDQWFLPTVLTDTTAQMRVTTEEIFAPVVTISRYSDFSAALKEVNASDYGLQAGIFTNDVNRIFEAFRTLEVGGVIGNDVPTYRIDHMPYGGVKGSGFGREGVKFAMEEMSELRLLALNLR